MTLGNSSAILSMLACVRSGDVMRSLSTGYLCCSSSCCFVVAEVVGLVDHDEGVGPS